MLDEHAALIEAQIPGLRRFARALSRGDRARADDLVQDGLERALACWQRRRSDGDLRGWLYTILYHRFLSEERRRRHRGLQLHLADAGEAELPEVDGGQDAALAHRDLLRALRELPQEQRSVLLLTAVDDLSYREAAQALGVPIGTVMSRLSRARERLRRHLLGEAAMRPQPLQTVGIGQRKRAPRKKRTKE
jgi:RNA polymerase sigma factor (sigma-70 family)